MRVGILSQKRFRELYGDAEADAALAHLKAGFPEDFRPGDNREIGLSVPVTPVAPLTLAEQAALAKAVPALAGRRIDWDAVDAARYRAGVENERVTAGVLYCDFRPYLETVARISGDLLRLLTAARSEMPNTLQRRGALPAELLEPLKILATRSTEMLATDESVYDAPPTLGITVLARHLAPVFEAAGLQPTSGRGGKQSAFAQFVGAVLRTMPIAYDPNNNLELSNLIDAALKARK